MEAVARVLSTLAQFATSLGSLGLLVFLGLLSFLRSLGLLRLLS